MKNMILRQYHFQLEINIKKTFIYEINNAVKLLYLFSALKVLTIYTDIELLMKNVIIEFPMVTLIAQCVT